MERVSLVDVARAVGAPCEGAGNVAVSGVSTDSRSVAPGDVFFAVRGERLDGHAFVATAAAAGAAAAVVSDRSGLEGVPVPLLEVRDTVVALGDLAAWYRKRFQVDVVGVTGTNGKTTTKDMTAAVLSSVRRTLKTEANLNSQIGVPITVLRLAREHESAVIEMGMDRPGQIARLAAISSPRVGVVTNVSAAHMKTMGTVDEIARAKGELLEALPADGAAVLNADDARVMAQAGRTRARIVTFGLGEASDVRGVDVRETAGGLEFGVQGSSRVRIPVHGRHNVANALAALAVGRALGVPHELGTRGLARFAPSPRRTAVVRAGRWTVIDDSYNSNPGSLRAALETLVSIAAGGRPTAAALGDMLELGEASESAHREAGRLAAELKIGLLFLFGREVQAIRAGALEAGMAPERVTVFEDKSKLVEALRGRAGNEPLVLLVKGSRGMRMEEVVERLTQEAPVS